MSRKSTSAAFFEAKYQASEDPWDFASSPYELGRYQAILSYLEDRTYQLAFEPGCSIGVLTSELALRCCRVEAYDLSNTALAAARKRCRHLRNVNFRQAALQDRPPTGADLYLFCEVGYYMTTNELEKMLGQHVAALESGAALVACHWLGSSPNHVIGGDEVHATIQKTPHLVHQFGERHKAFRIDRWAKE